jgi:hypothetical protein
MDKQIFIGRDKGHITDLLKPISNRRSTIWRPGFNLKPTGGFWTSTYDKKDVSDWARWCLWDMPEWVDGHDIFLLTPKPDVKLFIINSHADAIRLVKKYPFKQNKKDIMGNHFLNPDWEKIKEDYDGVRLTHKGQVETRMVMEYSMYGWDCESTLWFRHVFNDIIYLGKYQVGLRKYFD